MPKSFIFHKKNTSVDGLLFPDVSVHWKEIVESKLLGLPDGQVKITVESANTHLKAFAVTCERLTPNVAHYAAESAGKARYLALLAIWDSADPDRKISFRDVKVKRDPANDYLAAGMIRDGSLNGKIMAQALGRVSLPPEPMTKKDRRAMRRNRNQI